MIPSRLQLAGIFLIPGQAELVKQIADSRSNFALYGIARMIKEGRNLIYFAAAFAVKATGAYLTDHEYVAIETGIFQLF